MTKFLDGPCCGFKPLTLTRAPFFLRAVISEKNVLDALDSLDDEWRPGERLYAYRRVGDPVLAFVDKRDAKTGKRIGFRMESGHYRFIEPQPAQEIMRDNNWWQQWCEERNVGGKAK